MAKGLTKRVARIISGSVNAVVDAVENVAPEVVMEQAIREVDGVIEEVRNELGKVAVAKHLANKQLVEKNTNHEDLGNKIKIAIDEKREDLAEVAISAQLDIEAQIPVLETTIVECVEKEKELESYILALQAKKREMKEDIKLYRQSFSQKSSKGIDATSDNIKQNADRKVNQATSSFDRVLERKTGFEKLDSTKNKNDIQKLAELEQLARDNRVKERLAAIKASK
ncbi:PspA/IM30 family protein [Francisella philomiragia]|uniref:PspA/IM30 family protein n=1 Tax=Francisella philomiragia TaxID=28110 RepID=UPI001903E871|nr:PspA/IM30 family protein [Francisella philomiragia]MBK2267822.1 PspA/IM30 family protein [Francisella philomiragia]MBK2279078.1 PspA/IM30 family protein [Francisella philomiragia]MBK2287133.1 PspA/IM30 family protein [Francisella philomiragia]MBK2288910.1 PspA/IM30 family protein [Francisella philomiragia]MBK2290628.1 PspA/IM30 family protein [Francisella philomiragia]